MGKTQLKLNSKKEFLYFFLKKPRRLVSDMAGSRNSITVIRNLSLLFWLCFFWVGSIFRLALSEIEKREFLEISES